MSEWRRATADDAVGLRDLERAANLVALGHVFPPERFPFPDDDVLDRWRRVLADPGVTVEVLDGPGRLTAFAAYDASTVRHVAVHPDAWGSGVGRAGISRALEAIRAGGAERATLWVLGENHRARRLYDHLGWQPTGRSRECPWPPHPTEWEMTLVLDEPGGRPTALNG